MIIGVLSDTHDKDETATAALDYFAAQNITTVFHCGDWKSSAFFERCIQSAATRKLFIYAVLGNNDRETDEFIAIARQYPTTISLSIDQCDVTLDGARIVAHHGHIPRIVRDILSSDTIDIFLRGHSHKPLITRERELLTVNPGSTAFAIPRSTTWQPSVAVIDTAAKTAKIVYT